MELRLNIPDNASTEYVLQALGGALIAAAAAPKPELRPAPFVPVVVDGHQFTSQAELDAYRTQVAARDAALADPTNTTELVYTGPVDPDTLGAWDWAFAFQHDLFRREAEIFSKKPRMYADGVGSRDVTQGDLAAIDTSTYVTTGGVLARFL